jgi:hypothetical protein
LQSDAELTMRSLPSCFTHAWIVVVVCPWVVVAAAIPAAPAMTATVIAPANAARRPNLFFIVSSPSSRALPQLREA